MKVLWVKSAGVLPQNTGGNIRSLRIASELARRHEVTLFTFYSLMTPDPHDELSAPFARVERVVLDLPQRASIRDKVAYAANALTTRPYQMRRHCPPKAAQQFRKLLQDEHFDVILCDVISTAGVVPWDGKVPTVIFAHNVEAVIWCRHFEVSRDILFKLVAWREYWTMMRAERHFSRLANHVLTVSDNDRKFFLEFLPPAKVTTVPTGVDLDYFRPVGPPANSHDLVFVGAMDWMPNEDAVVYFANEILPLVHA